MAPRKKVADEATTPIQAPDAPGAPALPDNLPDEDDDSAALAKLAAEDDAPVVEAAKVEVDAAPILDTPVEPAQEASPYAPVLTNVIDEAPPVLTEEQRENVRLKRQVLSLEAEVNELQERIGEIRSSAQAEIDRLNGLLAGIAHKPPPAAVPAKDPLREARSFGVLATWLGPGMYGGPYYTVAGVQMPHAMGLTIGYFPAADIARSPEQFKAV